MGCSASKTTPTHSFHRLHRLHLLHWELHQRILTLTLTIREKILVHLHLLPVLRKRYRLQTPSKKRLLKNKCRKNARTGVM